MTGSATDITNLLYRYAELMDAGDFEGVAALFEHARVKTGPDGIILEGAAPMLANWRTWVKLYSCGTPRTKHVITNPIVEIDEIGGTATCRSYFTVLQAAPELPLQVIAAGRYHDVLRWTDGAWHFTERDYTLMDLHGNLSAHLLQQFGA